LDANTAVLDALH
jgi:hypothetical protein